MFRRVAKLTFEPARFDLIYRQPTFTGCDCRPRQIAFDAHPTRQYAALGHVGVLEHAALDLAREQQVVEAAGLFERDGNRPECGDGFATQVEACLEVAEAFLDAFA